MERGEAVVHIALDHAPTRLIDCIDCFDALKAQVVGANAKHWSILLMQIQQLVRQSFRPQMIDSPKICLACPERARNFAEGVEPAAVDDLEGQVNGKECK